MSTRLALWLAAATFIFPAHAQHGGSDRPPPAVTFVTMTVQDVPLTARLPGRVVAAEEAGVRPQVVGIISERSFTEGAAVEEGQPLFTVEADPYRAAVAQARAQVSLSQAELRAAESAADSAKQQVARGVSDRDALNQALAAVDSAGAQVAVSRASLQVAEIDLQRTTIRAPISGVIGRTLTSRGALVAVGQGEPLAIIRSLDPILVDITQSAAELLEWRRKIEKNPDGAVDQTVSLVLPDGKPYRYTGSLAAAEPNVDELTGVVTLRTRFPNPGRFLLPGMYVQVDVPQGFARDVVLAPQQGVSRNRRGEPTALVVLEDDTVEQRTLEIVSARGADWIVSKGLNDGDRLIVEGLQKTGPGQKVRPEKRSDTEPEPGDSGGAE